MSENKELQSENKALRSKNKALQSTIDAGQIAVNLEEAKHKSFFVAGWRPTVGWVCTVGITIDFLIIPVANMFLCESIEDLNTEELLAILAALLGIGGYRTFEKCRHVATHRVLKRT